MNSLALSRLLLLLSVWLGPDGRALPFQSGEEVTAFLRDAKVVKVVKKNLGGVTDAQKLLVENGGVQAHAVFRSFDRLYLKVTPYVHDSYRNELAAYELSRLLGLETVPPTVAWKMGRRSGSLQLWIENGQPGYHAKDKDRRPADLDRWLDEREKMRVFDALIENVDRNVGNMLVDPTGRVWWIDHTRSFGRQRKIEEPQRITRCERALFERLKAADPSIIAERLSPYIDGPEVEALLDRRTKLLALIESRIAKSGEAEVLFTLEKD